MALIEWRDKFSTGIASVDYEHRTLIDMLNALHSELRARPSQAEVADFLAEVHAKIAAHFALEEKTMREHGYDEYEDHKAEHEHLLDEIREIMDDHRRGAYENFDAVLARRLRDWFGVHFQTKDARLHRMLG